MTKELRKVGKDGKMRTIRSDSKYDEKYAKQLAGGIRYAKGYSIVELCRKWRISRTTYDNWVDTYEDFKHAHELGKMDYASWWHETFRGIATGEIKGNAGAAIFAMTNAEGINWSNKVDVNSTVEEKINTINIKVLPRKEVNVVEHVPDIKKLVSPDKSDE
jgi:hypothetical protein